MAGACLCTATLTARHLLWPVPYTSRLGRPLEPRLTVISDVLVPVERLALVGQVAVGDVYWPDHALLAQVAHEKLETNQSKDAQAEDGQDHHIRQLLHGLDQGAHNGLQAWRQPGTQGQTMQEILTPKV